MNETHKAEIHGVPGERARAAGVVRALWPLLAALFACGLFVGAALPQVTPGVAGIGFFAAAAFLVWAVRDGLRGIDAFFKGARGEESVAVLLAALFAYYACRLVWQSHEFNDMSTSNDATPLWIPQLSMAVGAVILLIAFIDEWVLELLGQRSHEGQGDDEALHNE